MLKRKNLTAAAVAFGVLAVAATGISDAAAQQTLADTEQEIVIDGSTVTLLDGTSVTLGADDIQAIRDALANPNAAGAERALQDAIASAGDGSPQAIAAAAAFAASLEPELAGAITTAAIRANEAAADGRDTSAAATLVSSNVVNVEGVEPNRVAAAIAAEPGLSDEVRQAAQDGLTEGVQVAGPPDQLPNLPQQAQRGQAIDTTENPAQDNASPIQ